MKWIIREVKSRRWLVGYFVLHLILIWGGLFVPEIALALCWVSTGLLFVTPKLSHRTKVDGSEVLVLYDDTKKDTSRGQSPDASSTDSGDDD